MVGFRAASSIAGKTVGPTGYGMMGKCPIFAVHYFTGVDYPDGTTLNYDQA